MTRVTTVFALILTLAVAGACRDKSSSNNADGGTGADAGGDHTIFDVQNDSMPVGTTVTVRGVVVTAIDTYGGRVGGIYVQEPEGGAFSGVFVYLNDTSAASLSVGDLVDVVGGVKDEFALDTDTTGRTLTEISPPSGGAITITKVGDGTVPTPPVLNPWDLAADDAEAEKWEGVPITFNDVAVTSAPRNVSSTDNTLKEMTVTGPFAVSSSLTDLPDTIMRDDCYKSITGIGDYFFSYKVLPRSAADMVGGGTNCLPQEAGDTNCDDGKDNDYDGFTDCEDFSCIDSSPALCVINTTVADVQNGTVSENSVVTLTDVVVTGKSFNEKNLWVQDQGAGGPYKGVYVYRGSGAATLPTSVVAGSVVTVTGQVQEFVLGDGGGESLTEIAGTVTVTEGGTTATIDPVTGLTLTQAKDEMYEGVLVTLEGVPVLTQPDTSDPNPANQIHEWSVGTAGADLWVDDDIYRYTPGAIGTCVNITGIMSWVGFDTGAAAHQRTIVPRSAADITAVMCP